MIAHFNQPIAPTGPRFADRFRLRTSAGQLPPSQDAAISGPDSYALVHVRRVSHPIYADQESRMDRALSWRPNRSRGPPRR